MADKGKVNYRARSEQEFRRAWGFAYGSEDQRRSLAEAEHARDLAILDELEQIRASLNQKGGEQ